MIETYVASYMLISGVLFFLGAAWHFVLNWLSLESDWSLSAFVSKGLTAGSAAIIPPFLFSFWDKNVLSKIDGVEYYLGISALVLFYFFVQSLIPQEMQRKKAAQPEERKLGP